MLAGPILLLVSIPIDTVVFIYNLYTKPIDSGKKEFDTPLTENDIALFETCLDRALKEKRSGFTDEKDAKKRANTVVNYTVLNKIIQEDLKIVDVMREMIYENNLGTFEPYMAKIKTYNLLKSIELDMRSNLEQNIEKLQRGIQNKMELVKRDEL